MATEEQPQAETDEVCRASKALNNTELDHNPTEYISTEGENSLAKSSSDINQFEEQLHESSNIIIEKGNMKWQTGFEELRLVVDKPQQRPGKWINAVGYSKLFDNG